MCVSKLLRMKQLDSIKVATIADTSTDCAMRVDCGSEMKQRENSRQRRGQKRKSTERRGKCVLNYRRVKDAPHAKAIAMKWKLLIINIIMSNQQPTPHV